jgi:LPXTG-motif cell wall-anchored protein
MNDDGNQPSPTFNPDAPTSSEDDPILYITGSNSTEPDEAEPYIGDAELLAANNTGNQSSPVFTAVGIAGAIGVGGAIAIFYFRKTKPPKRALNLLSSFSLFCFQRLIVARLQSHF